MKRLSILLVSGILCLTMLACGGKSNSADGSLGNGLGESSSRNENIGESENTQNGNTKDSEENRSLEDNSSENNYADDVSKERPSSEGNSGESSDGAEENETQEPVAGSYLEDLYEFKVSIGKIAYRLPISYNAMISRGWIYEDDETVTLKPSQYTSQELIERGDVILSASFFNVGINTQEIKDSLIGQLTFDRLNLIGCETEIRFPGNIIYGKSTREDVIFAYGEPTRIEEGEGKDQLIYEKGEYERITFTIDKSSNGICDVDLINFTEPENFDDGEISKETPKEVSNYTSPEELGDDLTKPYVKIADHLYQLPAPVSAFLDNGWSIVESGSHGAVVAKGAGTVTLEKNGLRITSDVINYADTAVYVQNCFVTTVYVDLEENKNGMMYIPKGICINMPASELETVLEGVRYTSTKDGRYTYYTITHKGGKENGFIIRINQENGKVDSIVCQEMPAQY